MMENQQYLDGVDLEARKPAISFASSRPCEPVQALAQPLLTTKPLTDDGESDKIFFET